MAKIIRVSNAVYEELKAIKEKENKSFTEVLESTISQRKQKTRENVKKIDGFWMFNGAPKFKEEEISHKEFWE